MKKVISVLRWICAVLLTIGIIVFGTIQIISSTILDKKYILDKLDATNYYINTYLQVNSDFENYIYQSGLDASILKDLVTVEDVENDTKYILSNIYEGKDKEIDTSKLKEKLSSNIEKSIEGKYIDSSTQKKIDKFINIIAEQYEDSILHTDIESNIFDSIFKIKKAMSSIVTVSATIMGLSVIFIIASRYKKFWQNITILGVPLVSTGIVYLALDIYIKSRVDIKDITILSQALSYSLRTIIFSTLDRFGLIGILLIVIGTILIITGNMIRTNKHRHSRK